MPFSVGFLHNPEGRKMKKEEEIEKTNENVNMVQPARPNSGNRFATDINEGL